MSQRSADTITMLRVIRWTEERYDEFMLDEGVRYLTIYLDGDRLAVDALSSLPEYWAWWFRQADHRNTRMVKQQKLAEWEQSLGRWERAKLTELFMISHNAEILEVRPPRRVMRVGIKTIIANRRAQHAR